MIFSDPLFIALLAGCWIGFFIAPRAHRTLVLALFGGVFYAIYAGIFAIAAVVLSVAAASARKAWQYSIVATAIIAILIYYKRPGIIVPLGFSYLAFELLHLVIERRRGRIAEARIVDVLAYALFMPCRVAGPIRRYPQFLAAIGAAEARADDVYAGVVRVLIGFAKKLIIADTLALTVGELSYVQTPLHAWTIVLAYALRIYFDFSAYSDIAIGFSRILGVSVPENFNYPYFAVSIREFWNRWHITLSHWVRDYVFLPLGRAFFGTPLRPYPAAIAVISYLITFLVVGAWHGLTGAFLLWGAYHGALLGAHHVWRARMPAALSAHPWFNSAPANALSIALTFICVCIGWVPFMTDLVTAQRLLTIMFLGGAR